MPSFTRAYHNAYFETENEPQTKENEMQEEDDIAKRKAYK